MKSRNWLDKNLSELNCRSASTMLMGLLIVIILSATSQSEDWPTYRHDNYRSGTTSEYFSLPLEQVWTHNMKLGPQPAWTETPALQDFWHNTNNHKSRVLYDLASHVVVAGDSLYFGSSNGDTVTCLDILSGTEQWTFFTGGPVRLAPTIADGKVYFGSDDGYVYCLNAADGSKIWSENASDSNQLMFANGRMVSICPVRTSVLVDNNVAYWGVGLFNGAMTGLVRYLCAHNAADGVEIWRMTPPKPTQGYLLATTNYLYAPAGKSTPTMYIRSNGSYQGAFNTYNQGRDGGCYALLTSDNKLFFGPHYDTDESSIRDYNAGTLAYEGLAWVQGNYLIVTSEYSYYSTDTTLCKLRRSDQQIVWSVSSPYRYELILADDILFVGGDDEVAVFNTSNGKRLWTTPVNGKAHGLVAANGHLFVTTDQGVIHCFTKLPGDLDGDNDVSLVAHWKLDETEGKIAHDDTGDNDGILHDNPTWQPSEGKMNGAIEFDGNDDYISTDFILNPGDGTFSVFAWIKGGAEGQAIISQTDGTVKGKTWGETWLGVDESQGKLMTKLVPPHTGRLSTPPLVSEFVITDGQWHHVGLVWHGSQRHLYVDGVEVAKDVGILSPLTPSDGGLYIGAGKTLNADSFWAGMIDDIRIYCRAVVP